MNPKRKLPSVVRTGIEESNIIHHEQNVNGVGVGVNYNDGREKSHKECISRKRKKLLTNTADMERNKPCCHCKSVHAKESYSKRQWNDKSPRCKSCCVQVPVVSKKSCNCCNKFLTRDSFSNSQWKGSTGAQGHEHTHTHICKSCVEEVRHQKYCHDCKKKLSKSFFIPSNWNGPAGKSRSCKDCTAKNTVNASEIKTDVKQCHRCKKLLGKACFIYNQWKGSIGKIRCCVSCYEDTITKEERLCQSCAEYYCKNSFSNCQWKGGHTRFRTCKQCVKKEKPESRKQDASGVDKGIDGDKLNSNKCDKSEQPKTGQVCKVKDNKKKQQNFETDPVVIKRMLSERVNTLPQDQDRKNFEFQWSSFPVSQLDEDIMAAKVVVRGSYGKIPKDERRALSIFIQNSITAMSLDQAISLRAILLQQKAMHRHFQIEKVAKNLYTKYKNGSTIVELSLFVDCPPMNVFRSILASMDYNKARIKKCLRNPEKELKEREQREFKEAEAVDSVSNVNQGSNLKFADAFEDVIAKFLEKEGVLFVRQKQLQLEQKKSFGTAILTPDFLILDTLKINGNRVTWIDAKAFYGANISFNIKKVKKQMSRYIDHWGEGAIIYLRGFSEMLAMDGCTMLNAQYIIGSEELVSLE